MLQTHRFVVPLNTFFFHLAPASEWGEWSSFGACSVTCGPGSRSRTRECENPVPKGGGEDCVGDDTSIESCNEGACSTDTTGMYGSYFSNQFQMKC